MKKILFALVIFSAVFMSCEGVSSNLVYVESVELAEHETVYGDETIDLEYVVTYSDGTTSPTLIKTVDVTEYGIVDYTVTVESVESNRIYFNIPQVDHIDVHSSTGTIGTLYVDNVTINYEVFYDNGNVEYVGETVFTATAPGENVFTVNLAGENHTVATVDFEDWRLVGEWNTMEDGIGGETYIFSVNGVCTDKGVTGTWSTQQTTSEISVSTIDFGNLKQYTVLNNILTINGGNLYRQ